MRMPHDVCCLDSFINISGRKQQLWRLFLSIIADVLKEIYFVNLFGCIEKIL